MTNEPIYKPIAPNFSQFTPKLNKENESYNGKQSVNSQCSEPSPLKIDEQNDDVFQVDTK